jgi:hypothetical protein
VSGDARLPDLTDSAAAADDWTLCAAGIAGGAAMRMLVRRKGRPVYPASTQRPLSDQLPATPAAVMLFDATGRLRCLALDLDAATHGPQQVIEDAADAVQLLTEAGLRPFVDVSPSGGRHIYAVLPQPVPAHEVAQVATALKRQLPSLDTSPLLNPAHGCIRPPGAVHKDGGHQRLLTPVATVRKALTAAVPGEAWRTLRQTLHADRIDIAPPPATAESAAATGIRRRGLATDYDELARTGRHPTRTYASPSEARMAVIGAAVRAGWGLTDLEHAVTGTWTWLHASYTGKYGNRWRSRVGKEFVKAKNTRGEHLCRRHVRDSDTSQRETRGAPPPSRTLPLTGAAGDPYLLLRKFFTFATDYARRHRFTPTQRSVLRAVVWVGQVQGGLIINAGCRSLAEQAGCHFDTVAATLHELASHGLVSRVREASGTEADLWQLHVELAEQHRPVRGHIRGLHPAFRVIGGHDTAEIHHELQHSPTPVTAAALATRLGYPTSRTHEQLRLLAGWNLAVRSVHGWQAGPADLDALSQRLGGHDAWQAQHDRHVAQRERWRDLLVSRGEAPLAGQLDWDAEFAMVGDDSDQWIQALAGGGPPDQTLNRAITLIRDGLGGQVIA